jgi:hypothetical protein
MRNESKVEEEASVKKARERRLFESVIINESRAVKHSFSAFNAPWLRAKSCLFRQGSDFNGSEGRNYRDPPRLSHILVKFDLELQDSVTSLPRKQILQYKRLSISDR